MNNLHVEFALNAAKLDTGQETSFTLADNMLSKLDRQGTKGGNCWTLPDKVKQSFKIPASQIF